jgi:two-component system chemotaxis sensor kinase CheA
VIRDMARLTDKKINLHITGRETEVDKSVLELLGDPLIHILRNSADHGIEAPEARREAGKPEVGTIRLTAQHQGSHVRVEIVDDGKGIDRDVIGRKAIEKGLTTAEQLVAMPDGEVFRFIFAAGFSTAEVVSDLSGRGVGMDVVRTNVNKMNGIVNVSSVPGQSTRIEILIPLTVAIMPAMVVAVSDELYCVPLQSIVEIVRPETQQLKTVSGQPVMKLRQTVLPLIDMHRHLRSSDRDASAVLGCVDAPSRRFAVVVCVGEMRAGLLVDRLIGQQEIVVKPLDDHNTQGGPFSGATIREDGQVSLILDVVDLIRQVQTPAKSDRQAA